MKLEGDRGKPLGDVERITPRKHLYCQISYHERTGYESVNYGIRSIDPHSHKGQTKHYKIPKFGVNRPNSKQDTAI